uniref:Uncharacterized protein n=1 Tax=Rhizophora mucronata TaxID=61149 RepID=A0A2P2NV77_RHIMU
MSQILQTIIEKSAIKNYSQEFNIYPSLFAGSPLSWSQEHYLKTSIWTITKMVIQNLELPMKS